MLHGKYAIGDGGIDLGGLAFTSSVLKFLCKVYKSGSLKFAEIHNQCETVLGKSE